MPEEQRTKRKTARRDSGSWEALRLVPDSCLIFKPPLLHGADNGPHGVTQFTEGVFYPGRDLRIHCSDHNSVLLQGAQAVGEDLLADPFQILFQFVEPPGPGQQVAEDQQLPLAPDQLNGGGDGAGRELFFCQHTGSSLTALCDGFIFTHYIS